MTSTDILQNEMLMHLQTHMVFTKRSAIPCGKCYLSVEDWREELRFYKEWERFQASIKSFLPYNVSVETLDHVRALLGMPPNEDLSEVKKES